MSKKKKKNQISLTGLQGNGLKLGCLRPSTYAIIISDSTGDPVFSISNDGDIFYRHNNEMTKVNCHDDLSQAFQECVFGVTGYNSEDVMIERYIQKILNHERSNEYMVKLESTFRKLKLQKLKNSNL